jgi:hypothetical protein
VALHTGQGNSWSNDRYKSMNSDQRKAAAPDHRGDGLTANPMVLY